jgi:predicted nucleotidyltransferase
MQKNIEIPHDQIAEFCRKHRIRKLSLFGSVLRDDFRPDSDVDVLVEFESDVELTLQVMIDMEAELKRIFRHDVDLGDIQSVKADANYIRRKHILNSARVIYER